MNEAAVELVLKSGHLYVPALAYENAMDHFLAVAVLWRPPFMHLIPLHSGSVGGFLVKQRNLTGDRVIDLRLFLLDQELVVDSDAPLLFLWAPEAGCWQTQWPCPALLDK